MDLGNGRWDTAVLGLLVLHFDLLQSQVAAETPDLVLAAKTQIRPGPRMWFPKV